MADADGKVTVELKVATDDFVKGLDEAKAAAVSFEQELSGVLGTAVDDAAKQFGQLNDAQKEVLKSFQTDVIKEYAQQIEKVKHLLDSTTFFEGVEEGKKLGVVTDYVTKKMNEWATEAAPLFAQKMEEASTSSQEAAKKIAEAGGAAKGAGEGAEEGGIGFFKLTGAIGLGVTAGEVITKVFEYFYETLKDGLNAFVEFEARSAVLDKALGNAGLSVSVMRHEIAQLGEELGDLRGAEQGYLALLQYDNIAKDVFPQLIRAAKDLSIQAEASGVGTKGLAANVRLLGQAITSPTQAFAQLRQSGLVLDPLIKAQIVHFAQLGDSAKVTSLLIEELNSKAGGFSDTLKGTLAGEIKRYREAAELSSVATGSWVAWIFKATGELDNYTAALERANRLSGIQGPIARMEQQIADLVQKQKEATALWDPFGVAAETVADSQKEIEGLQKKINEELSKSGKLELSLAGQSYNRVQALKLELADKQKLIDMTDKQRTIELELQKLREEGRVKGAEETARYVHDRSLQLDLVKAKEDEVAAITRELGVKASIARLGGNEALAKEIEFKIQLAQTVLPLMIQGYTDLATAIANAMMQQHALDLELDKQAPLTALQDEIAMLKAQTAARNMGTAAAAAFLKEEQLVIAAHRAGVKDIDAFRRSIHGLTIEYGALQENIGGASKMQDLLFQQDIAKFTKNEKQVATALREVYGEGWAEQANSDMAQLIRNNIQLQDVLQMTGEKATGVIPALHALTEEYGKGTINVQQYVKGIESQVQQIGSFVGMLQGFTSQMAQENETWFQVNKAFSIAQALISTYSAAARALEIFGPTPIGYAAAAIAVGTGLAYVAQIASTSPGTTSGGSTKSAVAPSGSASSGGGGGGHDRPKPKRRGGGGVGHAVNITLMGESGYSAAQVEDLAKQLMGYQNDGGKLVINRK